MSQVYFLHAPSVSRLKIGRSIDIERRLSELRLLSPVALHLIGAIPGGSTLEAVLHKRFTHIRLHGEWFDASDDLLSFAHEQVLIAAWNAAGTEARNRFRDYIDTPVMDNAPCGGDEDMPAFLRRRA